MENPSRDGPMSISDLPDDFIYIIFQKLVCGSDRVSFGLTCHRWLHVQNSCRKSLQFHCSFTQLSRASLSQTTASINSFQLYKLLNRFQHLESLSLAGCTDFPDSGLAPLQHYGSKLHTLYLDCCFRISDIGLPLIASGCPSLTAISLYRCNLSDIGLETLAKSSLPLKDVNLSYCSLISDHGISALSENCRQLRGVRISHCQKITGIGFKGCTQTLSYLEADSCKLKPEGILGIVSGGGLEYLNVSSLCWCIDGNGLSSLGTGLAAKLRILNFRMCRTASDEAITVISKGCPLLLEWNLTVCNEVRISGWESIGLNCCNIERLHVNRCRNLCDLGLQALRNGCKRLSVLYLSRGNRISSEAIELFKCLRGQVVIKEEEKICVAPKWIF